MLFRALPNFYDEVFLRKLSVGKIMVKEYLPTNDSHIQGFIINLLSTSVALI